MSMIFGFDPGSRVIGWAMLRQNGSGKPLDPYWLEYAGKGTIEIGHVAPLAKPRKRGNGEIKNENVIDDGDLERFHVALLTVIGRAPGARVVVERERHIVRRPGFGPSMASYIAAAEWVGGEIAAACRSRGYTVSTIEAGKWRRALVSRSAAKDSDIAPIVLASVQGWPTSSNAHERDAAGVAIIGSTAPIVADR